MDTQKNIIRNPECNIAELERIIHSYRTAHNLTRISVLIATLGLTDLIPVLRNELLQDDLYKSRYRNNAREVLHDALALLECRNHSHHLFLSELYAFNQIFPPLQKHNYFGRRSQKFLPNIFFNRFVNTCSPYSLGKWVLFLRCSPHQNAIHKLIQVCKNEPLSDAFIKRVCDIYDKYWQDDYIKYLRAWVQIVRQRFSSDLDKIRSNFFNLTSAPAISPELLCKLSGAVLMDAAEGVFSDKKDVIAKYVIRSVVYGKPVPVEVLTDLCLLFPRLQPG